MTPFTHITIDTHITAHQSQVHGAVQQAKAHPGMLDALRTHLARGLVKTGAWLLPDTVEDVAGTLLILPDAPAGDTGRKAA